MKLKTKNLIENIVHGIFLVLGLVTVASVLLITVYLIVSGIPAIKEIGIPDFLLGKKWASTAELRHPAVYPHERLRHRRSHCPRCAGGIYDGGVSCENGQ